MRHPSPVSGIAFPVSTDPQFEIRNHIEKVIIVVVLISISPGIVAWARAKMRKPAAVGVTDRAV